MLQYPNGKTALTTDKDGKVTGGGTIKLSETVKVIGENAFYMCGNLYSIEFNEGLEKIENKAFLKCTNLSSLEFPETLSEIGVDSFSYCDSLTHLEIPASVKSIGDYAFFQPLLPLIKSQFTGLMQILLHSEKTGLPTKRTM